MRLDAWQDDHDDRRAARRHATQSDALLEHADGTLHGLVVDISFAGAKFVTRTVSPVLEVGSRVILAVTSHGGAAMDDLTWKGRVARSERSGDDGPDRLAYGIAFDDFAARPIPGLDELHELD